MCLSVTHQNIILVVYGDTKRVGGGVSSRGGYGEGALELTLGTKGLNTASTLGYDKEVAMDIKTEARRVFKLTVPMEWSGVPSLANSWILW